MPIPTYIGCFNHHQDLPIPLQNALADDEFEIIYTLNDYEVSKKFTAESDMPNLVIPNYFNEQGVWEFKLYKNNTLLGHYAFENKQKAI